MSSKMPKNKSNLNKKFTKVKNAQSLYKYITNLLSKHQYYKTLKRV